MVNNSSHSETNRTVNEVKRRQAETEALLMASQAVLRMTDFNTTARAIFDTARQVIGATSGYVALLTEDGAENEVLFLESGGLPCNVDESLPMPIRGLRERAYRERKVVYDNGFGSSEWTGYLPDGHVQLDAVLFAPLLDRDKAVGLIGLANKPGGFTRDDARIAGGLGEVVSIALINSRTLELLKASETKYRKKTEELEEALSQVRSLKGLLPICASCKNIRDDKGYWQAVESYISSHAEVEFTHGLCPGCIRKLYPDIADEIIGSEGA